MAVTLESEGGELVLFAYGTLLTGAADPSVRALIESQLRARRPAMLPGLLYDLGPYPGALPGAGWVRGELLHLRDTALCLPLLDGYEDCDPLHPERGLYRRERAEAVADDGGAAGCWVYWLNRCPAGARPIPNGVRLPGSVTRVDAGRIDGPASAAVTQQA